MSEHPVIRADLPQEDIAVVRMRYVRGPGDFDCYHLMHMEGWWTLREGGFPVVPARKPIFVPVGGAVMWRARDREQAIERATVALQALVTPVPMEEPTRTPDGYCLTCGQESNRGHCACPCEDCKRGECI